MSATYEVQSLKDGRWMIEFRTRNEEEAVSEARALYESKHYKAVKVVREVFDQGAKLFKETVVVRYPQAEGTTERSLRGRGAKKDFRVRPRPKPPSKAKQEKRSLLDFLKS